MKCGDSEARYLAGKTAGAGRRCDGFKGGSRGILRRGTAMLALLLAAGVVVGSPAKDKPEPVMLVVMDPLAKELACACVKGYGQRDYRKLAARLEKTIKQRVSIEFSDDLAESMVGISPGREIIVVGDQSLVAHGAKKAALKCHPVCELTDTDGNTTLTGLFIARSDDPAKELKDIGGRKVFFGLGDADEEFDASLAALRAAGVEADATGKRASYSGAAMDVLDSKLSPPPVAVIPSYALPLLEGCGSVQPGSLKVIGKTEPVPFITLFIVRYHPGGEGGENFSRRCSGIKGDAKLLKAMESRDGFKPLQQGRRTDAWTGRIGAGRHATGMCHDFRRGCPRRPGLSGKRRP